MKSFTEIRMPIKVLAHLKKKAYGFGACANVIFFIFHMIFLSIFSNYFPLLQCVPKYLPDQLPHCYKPSRNIGHAPFFPILSRTDSDFLGA